MALAEAQHVPLLAMHTPPLQLADVVQPPSGRSEPPPSDDTVPSSLASLAPPPVSLPPLDPQPLDPIAAASAVTYVK
jgi:hypothetical protein